MAKQTKKFNYNDVFPTRFRGLIKYRNVTFDVLAEAFSTTRQTVSNWQAGSTVPDAISISMIADYFGVTTDYLLGKTDASTVKMDLRAAADYTGLSEKAIEQLRIISSSPLYRKPLDEQYLKKDRAFWVSDIIEDGTFEELCLCIECFYACSYWMAKKRIELANVLLKEKQCGNLYEAVYYRYEPKQIMQNKKCITVKFENFKKEYTDEYERFIRWVDSFSTVDSIARKILEEDQIDSEPCDIQQLKLQKLLNKKLEYADRMATDEYLEYVKVGVSNGTDNEENG